MSGLPGGVSVDAAFDAAGARQRSFSYDNAARLTSAVDVIGACSTARTYGFGVASDRVSKTATPGAGCPGQASSWVNSFNAASQQTQTARSGGGAGSGAYAYDAFGRTTGLPGVDTPTGVDVVLSYNADGTAASTAQGGQVMAWGRDPARRIVTTALTGSGTETNHYAGGGDSPAWISHADGGFERVVTGPVGGVSVLATTTAGGATTAVLQVGDPHGDVVATAALAAGRDVTAADVAFGADFDEYGVNQTTTAMPAPPGYGWEGVNARSASTTPGLVLMGARLYNPATGRFLTLDPVPGGNANPYTYPPDPCNQKDLDGMADGYDRYGNRITGRCRSNGRTTWTTTKIFWRTLRDKTGWRESRWMNWLYRGLTFAVTAAIARGMGTVVITRRKYREAWVDLDETNCVEGNRVVRRRYATAVQFRFWYQMKSWSGAIGEGNFVTWWMLS